MNKLDFILDKVKNKPKPLPNPVDIKVPTEENKNYGSSPMQALMQQQMQMMNVGYREVDTDTLTTSFTGSVARSIRELTREEMILQEMERQSNREYLRREERLTREWGERYDKLRVTWFITLGFSILVISVLVSVLLKVFK